MRRNLSRKASFVLLLVIAVALLLVDLYTKLLVRGSLSLGQALPFIPGLVEIRLAFNDGAAFGLFAGGGALFVVIAVVVVAMIFTNTALRPKHSWLEIVAEALVMAGALGNAVDRLGDGLVTDFFNLLFIDFAVFNVADSCLTCGVILWIIWLFFDGLQGSGKQSKGTKLSRGNAGGNKIGGAS